MTNEQLTKEVTDLKAYQAKCQAQHESYKEIFDDMRDDIKATRDLAENVHLMAQSMQSMQKAQDNMNKRLDELASADYVKYKENKKIVQSQLLSGIVGAFLTFVIAIISWIIMGYIHSKGG